MTENVEVAIVTGIFGIIGMFVTYFLSSGKKESKCGTVSLKNHHIFSRSEMLKTYILAKFTLPNKGKELVFKDMLLNYIKIWENLLMELAHKLDGLDDNISPTELQAIVMKCFNDGTKEFSSYYKNDQYTENERLCLDTVMNKFNSWNYQRVQSVGDSLMSICNSQFYSTKTIKSAVIFDMYIQLFVDMVYDAEQTMGSINGDMRGLVFRGVTL